MSNWKTELAKALQLLDAMGAGATAKRGEQALFDVLKILSDNEKDLDKAVAKVYELQTEIGRTKAQGFWPGFAVGACVAAIGFVAWAL